ncbi:iron complex transport system ATP-binding protein [Desulfatibacillum alkenivorans DSM 16219]|jgi:iron complex transport system ATP-binding protein|uniref:Iron complex transport system ATP-binding protein n=1 Tax=Desulfatibacillum alkenivorans DSM 16219 TaxID=1121393 RepID=A0A1M6UBV7_9BACT|nr:iron complex transport system ATP-binding protein [Desulfatibacillum alkenivorans DSM 16219]
MGHELQDIWFSYGDRSVLSGVSLELESGLFHGVLGPNGSGKTTLLDLISGHLKPNKGRVFLEGRAVDKAARRELARKCALVPQDFRVNFPFTAAQVVMMGRYPHIGRFGAPSQEDWDMVEEAMESTGTRDFAQRNVTELSGGERQRVVFARALAQNAETLILDEATSNLDVRHTLALMRLAADKVREAGLTVISVMQDINLAARFCQSLLFLKNGKAAAHGPVDDILTEPVIQAVFEVKSKVYFDETIQRKQVVFL